MELFTEMNLFLHRSLNIGLLIISLACPAIAAKRVIGKSVAIVNDEVILASDVDKFQQKIRSKSYQELFGAVDPRALNNRDIALQMLIEEKIINQQVKKLELTVNDAELDGQMKAIRARNGISPDQLNLRLKQLGTTMAEYREGIRRQIERRNLVEREVKPNLEIGEDQLKNFFTRMYRPDPNEKQYKIAHIFFDAKKGGAKAAEKRATLTAKELSENPESFSKLVKEVSDDTSTAEQDGLLGFLKADQLSKEFRAVVPKTKAGDVTAPIKAAAGYHIVKVLEVSSVDFNSLSKEQKDVLRNQMIGEELERKMGTWLERKKADAFIRISKE
jgi:peptidyl-prolyl cis-trans isomerase SurA